MRNWITLAGFGFYCVMFFVTYLSLFALPVIGGIWWVFATFPQFSHDSVILNPNMTIYLVLLFSVGALFGSLAGGLNAPWKAHA